MISMGNSMVSGDFPVKTNPLISTFTGRWYTVPTPLKNDGVSNSWDDDDIPFPTYGKS